jgi:hypothetical protein
VTAPPLERLYHLLPYVYRLRDGGALRTFLQVVDEQVAVLEADLDRLYDNWFIETCDESIVPYIGELVGWAITARAGEPGAAQGAEGMLLRRTLAPRADVARTLAFRRRKGTLALLEELARTIAGWPPHAVEFFRRLSYTQPINHLRLERGQTVDVGDRDALARLHDAFGAFATTAHTVDVRRATSRHGRGRYNIPSVGLFAWRLRAWPVTECQPYLQEGIVDRDPRRRTGGDGASGCFHFDILGVDAPLFIKAEAEDGPFSISTLPNVPARLTRHALSTDLARYYGPDKSLCIWLGTDRPGAKREPVPVAEIVVADLTEWAYAVPEHKVLVDPELGRFKVRVGAGVRPSAEDPIGGARVSYHHGFAAAIGGGEYDRALDRPRQPHRVFTVGPGGHPTLAAALAAWRTEAPARAIIEVATRAEQLGPVRVELAADQVLILRAADRYRGVIRLLDERPDGRDAFVVAGDRGSRFVCDGFLVTGRGVSVSGPLDQVVFRHCTLPPPGLSRERRASGPPASLVLDGIAGDVAIDRCIVGPIAVTSAAEPTRVAITSSIVDAGHPDDDAFSDGPIGRHARAELTLRATTVFGRVTTHAIALAENSIFSGLVRVARRNPGCVRFCYVPAGSRTPRRYHCQPDLVLAEVPEAEGAVRAVEADRVRPVWTSRRHGDPGYAQLWRDVAREIGRGADDESEMGAFHDLYWPQREDALAQRLAEYVPAGADAGIFFVT